MTKKTAMNKPAGAAMRANRLTIAAIVDLRDGTVRPADPDNVAHQESLAGARHGRLLHHQIMLAGLNEIPSECALENDFPHLRGGGICLDRLRRARYLGLDPDRLRPDASPPGPPAGGCTIRPQQQTASLDQRLLALGPHRP